MNNTKSKYTRGRSLDLLYVFLRYFFETEYLHFGYWKPGVKLKFANLKQAQEAYIEELFKLIPDDVESILDVGCGSGEMATQLLKKNFKVDAVCPPSIMSENASLKLGDKARLYECKYEELDIDKKYDLIVFSESIQFIQIKDAFEQCRRYGNKYILIADLFKNDMPEKGPIGGGKPYKDFLSERENFDFKELENIDITTFVAPSFDLEQDAINNFVRPLLSVFKRIMAIKNSWLTKIGLFAYRKKLTKMRTRYLEKKDRNSESFAKYKSYRFILLEITAR
ncbi:MAG: methyltransferase domain-containing protein [Gammaproteobacteria bacterium]|nr:methyltransferase domain-containing protein [Gammaproteobacteria bacterium]